MADRSDTFYAIATSTVHGYGAQLKVGDGGTPTETFQAIAALSRIAFGSMDTADIITTHLRSPNAHQEHRPGLRDSGAIQIEGRYLPTDESQSYTGGGSGSFTSGGLIGMWEDRQIRNFKLVLPDQTGSPSVELPIRGYVSQFQLGEVGPDDIVNFTAAIMPSEDFSADLP